MKLAQRYKSFIHHLKDKKIEKKQVTKLKMYLKKQCQKSRKQTFKTKQGVLK